MKISYGWLREFLPGLPPAEDLARELALIGFEVAGMSGPGFSGVVVGRVLELRRHPNADRLTLCSVSDGRQTVSIVCGAKNVAAGALVPVALPGARLPDGRGIERSRIRGEESQGMICSAAELGMPDDGQDGILILPADAPVGEDAARLLGQDNRVLDVEVPPNRPDCLSHFGLARELSLRLRLPLTSPAPKPAPVEGTAPARPVRVEAIEACPRYLGREFSGLRAGPSPGWLAGRLEACGLRPINAVVDATNYALLELGHPLHAFDADKLQGPVSVRRAKEGEKFKALDGRDYALSPEDLVVADAAGPAALAGVMGGERTAVTDKTTRVFLESACFLPASVRRSSKRHALRTEASYRFERGTDPETAALAAARAAELLLQLCGGKAGPSSDARAGREASKSIEVSAEGINRILGGSFPKDEVEDLLRRLAPDTKKPGAWLPPPHRLDLATPWDLAEEVARHLGYERIPAEAAPVPPLPPARSPLAELCASLRLRLQALGFVEAYNYDFLSTKEWERVKSALPSKSRPARVLNPVSEDLALLRPTLLAGLLRNAAYNLSRGSQGLRFFEIGNVYQAPLLSPARIQESAQLAGLLIGNWPPRPHWRATPAPTDFFDAKGAVEALLAERPGVEFAADGGEGLFHPKACGRAVARDGKVLLARYGQLHPELLEAWDLPGPAAAFVLELDVLLALPVPPEAFAPLSPFPSIARDLSIVAAAELSYAGARAAVQDLESLARVELVDVYEGRGIPQGSRGLTLRLTFNRPDRTLREEEVEAQVARAVKALRARGAMLRG